LLGLLELPSALSCPPSRADRTFTDIAGLDNNLTVEEDKITAVTFLHYFGVLTKIHLGGLPFLESLSLLPARSDCVFTPTFIGGQRAVSTGFESSRYELGILELPSALSCLMVLLV